MNTEAKSPRTVFGLITSASAQTAKESGKAVFMLDIVNPKNMGASKQFVSPKVIAHAISGDSTTEVDPKDLVGKYFSATCHLEGDMLHDESLATTDTLINNSTVTFMSKAQVKELMSF